MTPWFQFMLAALACWRVTHFWAAEKGPASIVVRIRAVLGRSWLGDVMDCFLCLSLWVSMPAAALLAQTAIEGLLLWLALSAASCLLERLGSGLTPQT